MTNILAILALLAPTPASVGDRDSLITALEGDWYFEFCSETGNCSESGGEGLRRYRRTLNPSILGIQECFVKDGTQFVGSFGYLPAAKRYFEFGYTQDRTSTLAMSGLLENNRIQFQPSWSGSKEPYRADMILDLSEARFSFIGYSSKQGSWQKQYTANFRRATAEDQARCTLPNRG